MESVGAKPTPDGSINGDIDATPPVAVADAGPGAAETLVDEADDEAGSEVTAGSVGGDWVGVERFAVGRAFVVDGIGAVDGDGVVVPVGSAARLGAAQLAHRRRSAAMVAQFMVRRHGDDMGLPWPAAGVIEQRGEVRAVDRSDAPAMITSNNG